MMIERTFNRGTYTDEAGLNPYSNGMMIERTFKCGHQNEPKVLILILME